MSCLDSLDHSALCKSAVHKRHSFSCLHDVLATTTCPVTAFLRWSCISHYSLFAHQLRLLLRWGKNSWPCMAHQIRGCLVTPLKLEAKFVYSTGIFQQNCWNFLEIPSSVAFELLSFIHQFLRVTLLISFDLMNLLLSSITVCTLCNCHCFMHTCATAPMPPTLGNTGKSYISNIC